MFAIYSLASSLINQSIYWAKSEWVSQSALNRWRMNEMYWSGTVKSQINDPSTYLLSTNNRHRQTICLSSFNYNPSNSYYSNQLHKLPLPSKLKLIANKHWPNGPSSIASMGPVYLVPLLRRLQLFSSLVLIYRRATVCLILHHITNNNLLFLRVHQYFGQTLPTRARKKEKTAHRRHPYPMLIMRHTRIKWRALIVGSVSCLVYAFMCIQYYNIMLYRPCLHYALKAIKIQLK